MVEITAVFFKYLFQLTVCHLFISPLRFIIARIIRVVKCFEKDEIHTLY